MSETVALPLDGVRVVDLTTNMSGPLATMVLADQGADVVKVEPLAGDLIRTVGTGRGGMSAYFANLNRGKRSICIDLGTEAGRDLVLDLADRADVFVQNFRPGVVERLGVDPASVQGRNPALIYASISGFGTDGPLASAPAYDHVVQALAGYCALQGDDAAASMIKQGLVDKATSYTTAQAITAALLARMRTGSGARIDVSMLDVALAFLWPDGMMNDTVIDPDQVLPPVARSFKVTPTADGFVSLVTLTAAQWSGLVRALADDADAAPDLSDTAARMEGGAAIMREVRAKVASLTTDEVIARLRAADVPCAPVLRLDQLHEDEQIRSSGALQTVDHPVMGPIRQPVPAPRFDGERLPMGAPAVPAGMNTRDVLSELGYDDSGVDALIQAGVVAAG